MDSEHWTQHWSQVNEKVLSDSAAAIEQGEPGDLIHGSGCGFTVGSSESQSQSCTDRGGQGVGAQSGNSRSVII